MLIEIEGPRGAGKSTLISALCDQAGSPGLRFVSASAAEEKIDDPGWSLGVFMRGLDEPMPPRESLFLYCARTSARARLSSWLTEPGTMVLSDRLSLSLYVQARLTGIGPSDAWVLVRMALAGVSPDCTILLDADYPAHLRRVKSDGREPQQEPEFQAARNGFAQAYAAIHTAKFRVDTTAMSLEEVRAAVLRQLPLTRQAG